MDSTWHPQTRGELLGQNSAKCSESCLQPRQCRLWRFASSSWMRNLRASRMAGSRGVCADTSSLTLPGSSSYVEEESGSSEPGLSQSAALFLDSTLTELFGLQLLASQESPVTVTLNCGSQVFPVPPTRNLCVLRIPDGKTCFPTGPETNSGSGTGGKFHHGPGLSSCSFFQKAYLIYNN